MAHSHSQTDSTNKLQLYALGLAPPLEEINDAKQLTFPDLHGNTVGAAYRLEAYGVLKLQTIADRQKLCEIYENSKKLTKEDLNEFIAILARATFDKNRLECVRLIGDVFGDRGLNDILTLYLLANQLPLEIIFSNHDQYFLKWYFGIAMELKDQARSLKNLIAFIDREKKEEKSIEDNIRKLIREVYFPKLKLIQYSIDRSTTPPTITLYIHSASGLEAIEGHAKYYGIEFKDATPEELCETIDEIHHRFNHQLISDPESLAEQLRFEQAYEDISIEFRRRELFFSEVEKLPAEEKNKIWHEELSICYSPLISPFNYVAWNRDESRARGPSSNAYPIRIVHGHNNSKTGSTWLIDPNGKGYQQRGFNLDYKNTLGYSTPRTDREHPLGLSGELNCYLSPDSYQSSPKLVGQEEKKPAKMKQPVDLVKLNFDRELALSMFNLKLGAAIRKHVPAELVSYLDRFHNLISEYIENHIYDLKTYDEAFRKAFTTDEIAALEKNEIIVDKIEIIKGVINRSKILAEITSLLKKDPPNVEGIELFLKNISQQEVMRRARHDIRVGTQKTGEVAAFYSTKCLVALHDCWLVNRKLDDDSRKFLAWLGLKVTHIEAIDSALKAKEVARSAALTAMQSALEANPLNLNHIDTLIAQYKSAYQKGDFIEDPKQCYQTLIEIAASRKSQKRFAWMRLIASTITGAKYIGNRSAYRIRDAWLARLAAEQRELERKREEEQKKAEEQELERIRELEEAKLIKKKLESESKGEQEQHISLLAALEQMTRSLETLKLGLKIQEELQAKLKIQEELQAELKELTRPLPINLKTQQIDLEEGKAPIRRPSLSDFSTEDILRELRELEESFPEVRDPQSVETPSENRSHYESFSLAVRSPRVAPEPEGEKPSSTLLDESMAPPVTPKLG